MRDDAGKAQGAAVDRIKRLYAKELESSAEASDALNYLDKRRDNMRYGWLRKHGYYISSCHIEAAARILVARSDGTPCRTVTARDDARLRTVDARVIASLNDRWPCARRA